MPKVLPWDSLLFFLKPSFSSLPLDPLDRDVSKRK